MKLSILASLATLLAVGTAVMQPQKQVIVSYPDDTPDSVIETAMNEIKAAGGYITHEYKIFKGFAAEATEKALETVKTLGASYNPTIEADQVLSIPKDGPQ